MVNTFALVISIILLVLALYIVFPSKRTTAEISTTNAQIAKVWMMASAIVLAMGYLLGK